MVNEETTEYFIEKAFISVIGSSLNSSKFKINIVGFNFEEKKQTEVSYPAVLVDCQPFIEYSPGARFGTVTLNLTVRTHCVDDKTRAMLRRISYSVFQRFSIEKINADFESLPDNYLLVKGIVEEDSEQGLDTTTETFEKSKVYKITVATNLA